MTIDDETLRCWRMNFGLDKHTPEEAGRWWNEQLHGCAPSGAVAALGLCICEIERLRAEVAALTKDAERYRWLLDPRIAHWETRDKYALAAVEAYKASLKPVGYFQPHNVDEADERIPVIGWRYESKAYTMPLYRLDGGDDE